MDCLPQDIVFRILSLLPARDACSASCTDLCKFPGNFEPEKETLDQEEEEVEVLELKEEEEEEGILELKEKEEEEEGAELCLGILHKEQGCVCECTRGSGLRQWICSRSTMCL
jgi:hypothetical protein